MSDFGVLLAVVVVVGIAHFGYWYAGLYRARELLVEWAGSNGFQLLESERREFLRGPFWGSSKSRAVYRVRVRDRHGRVMSGWVRCGDWFCGRMEGQVDVKWDEE